MEPSLILITANGRTRFAQFDDYDGHPGALGVRIFDFLRSVDRAVLKERSLQARFLTAKELKAIRADRDNIYPQVEAQASDQVLWGLYEEEYCEFEDSSDYRPRAPHCWVIDLDEQKLRYESRNTPQRIWKFSDVDEITEGEFVASCHKKAR